MPGRDNKLDTWTFATDEDGDLRFTSLNTLATTEAHHAIVQDLKVALATVQGEDPRDEQFGLDVFEATQSITHLKREIRRTLLYDDYRYERVEAVPEVEVYRAGHRRGEVTATIRLDTGAITTLSFSVPL